MKIPTFKVVNGTISSISEGAANFEMVGPGYPQAIPETETYNYGGNCIYKSLDSFYNLDADDWTLELTCELKSSIYLVATLDYLVSAGGWSLLLNSNMISLYTTVMVENRPQNKLVNRFYYRNDFRLRGKNDLTLIKTDRVVEIYAGCELLTKVTLARRSGKPGVSFLGYMGTKKDTYSHAGNINCEHLAFHYGYPFTTTEINKKVELLGQDEAWSFFNPSELSPTQFNGDHLVEVKNYSTTADGSGESASFYHFEGKLYENYGYDTYIKSITPVNDNLWKVFDGSGSVIQIGAEGGWIEIGDKFNRPIAVSQMEFTAHAADNIRVPRDFQLWGKNSLDAEWEMFYEATDAPLTGLSLIVNDFSPVRYAHYRIVVTRGHPGLGGTAVWVVKNIRFKYVPYNGGNKSFDFRDGERETIPIKRSSSKGVYLKGTSRGNINGGFTCTLSNGVNKSAQTKLLQYTHSTPWGSGSGIIARNSMGEMCCKALTGKNLHIETYGRLWSSKGRNFSPTKYIKNTKLKPCANVNVGTLVNIANTSGSSTVLSHVPNVFTMRSTYIVISPSDPFATNGGNPITLTPGVWHISINLHHHAPGSGAIQLRDSSNAVLLQSVANPSLGFSTISIDDILLVQKETIVSVWYLGKNATATITTYAHTRFGGDMGALVNFKMKKVM